MKVSNGFIDKNAKQCVAVYNRGSAAPKIALGGIENTSTNTLPVTLVVHWTDNTDTCEQKAQEIYERLFGASNFLMGTRRIAALYLLDPCPINVARDRNNIAEMVIRLNIIYEM
jgi:hypothetical protein